MTTLYVLKTREPVRSIKKKAMPATFSSNALCGICRKVNLFLFNNYVFYFLCISHVVNGNRPIYYWHEFIISCLALLHVLVSNRSLLCYTKSVSCLGMHFKLLPVEPFAKRSFRPNSALCSKFYPRNINHMPVVKFLAFLDFERKS